MIYNPTYYFFNRIIPETRVCNDVYFVGAEKGRLESLLDIQKRLNEHNVTTKFHITKSKTQVNNDYEFVQQISYQNIIDEILKSRAILDYLQFGQSGMSQRVMEALCYRKKLITNDLNVVNYDFYNTNNIFIIGRDDWSNIYNFLNSPYENIDEDIVKQYDFSAWYKRIIEGTL